MKKILLPILSLILAACSSSQVAVTRSAQVTVTSSPPPTATPIPTPTLHPQFVALQAQISASGERFTLLPNGTIQDGAKTVPGLVVDKSGAITLQGQSSQVTINPEDVSFDDEKGINVAGYTLDEATGKWEMASLTIENLDAKKWGNYSLIESPDGYYEMKDVQGNLIPEVKLFRDGTAELTHEIDGKTENLWIAFQAISVGEDGQLVLGLWEYANGAWTDAITGIAPKSSEEMESYHKLVILEGHEKEQAMIETVFLARDQAMAKSEKYDPASEFDGISVTVNFKTIDNFDVRPKEWQINNWGRSTKGAYRFQAISSNSEVGYDDLSRLAYARPMQVALGSGWFNMDIYNADGTIQPPAVHIPIVAMNTDRSLISLSSILRTSYVATVTPSLTKEGRGNSFIWIIKQPDIPKADNNDQQLNSFMARVNAKYFEEVDMPELDEDWPLKSLPAELKQTILYTGIW